MRPNTLFLMFIAITISGCAMFGGNSNNSSKIPKTSQTQKPGGNGENWRYLGTTDDGSLIDEIDVNSISSGASKQNTQVFNFEDRKTEISPGLFPYPTNQPRFKYLISTWQINCNSKEYLLNTATLYNDTGVKLIRYNYANDANVKWLKLGNGSFAVMQYNFICLNTNRNLGY